MPYNFISGHNAKVTFTVSGGANAVLDVEGAEWMEEVVRNLTTHVNSGGVQSRLAGPLDGKGSFKATYDLLKPPFANPPFLRAGNGGIVYYYFGGSGKTPFQCPVIIASVSYPFEVQGKVSWSVSVEMDSSQGLYVYPAA